MSFFVYYFVLWLQLSVDAAPLHVCASTRGYCATMRLDKPPTAVCSVRGTPISENLGTLGPGCETSTLLNCASVCYGGGSYRSLEYSNGHCVCYSKHVTSSDITPNDTSSRVFYDSGCFRYNQKTALPAVFNLQLVTDKENKTGELLQSIDKISHQGWVTGFAPHGHFMGYPEETVQKYRHNVTTGYFTTYDGIAILFANGQKGLGGRNAVMLQDYNPPVGLRLSCQIDNCTHFLRDCTVPRYPLLTHLAIDATSFPDAAFEIVDLKNHSSEYLVNIRAVLPKN